MARFLSRRHKFLAGILIFSILSIPIALSDDTRRGIIYVLDDLSGGIASKISEYALSPRQALTAENIRVDQKYKSISRRTNLNTYGSADATEAIIGMARHYKKDGTKVLVVAHGDELEKGADSTGAFTNILSVSSGDHRWQFQSWHDILIGTDGYNQPVKYDGASASATYLGSLLATLDTSGSGPASGAYKYKVSCYSATKEVLLNVPSNTITADGNDVLLSMIPVCNDVTLNGEATVGRKIYRTKTGGSTYYLLSNGTIADNSTVILTDSDADAGLSETTYPAGDATWTPPKARFLIIQNNRLFFANDPTNSPSRIWYGSDGSHDIFDSSNESGYFDIRQNDGDTITFIKSVLGILTVGKNNTIQKLFIDGSDPDADWSISDPLSYVGCQAPYSASNSPIGIIYLGIDGLYRFNGQYSELLSESVTPEINDISPTNFENTWGIYHGNKYYLAYNSEKVGGATNNRVLVLDVLGKAYTIDTLSLNAFTAFNSGNDWGILYAGSSTNGSVYAFSNEVNEVVHKRWSDFTGLWDDMRYVSTVAGGTSESPVLEISRTETIDELPGTIDELIGDIDRQDNEGHYVSQPISIGANGLDKIYWNESIPGAGGNVTFQVRTSSTGEDNLILNDDFEFWDNWDDAGTTEEPNDWDFAQDGTGGSADQSTEEHRGTYSTKITKSNSGQSYVSINIPDATSYQSKTLAFSAWVKSANSVGSKVRIQITDGTSTTTTNYANGGDWEELEGTIAVNAAATTITLKCVVETGADAVAYFDQIMVGEASSVANDWSAWSTTAYTDSSGSDISGETANTYVQYLINMTTTDIDYTPTVSRIGDFVVKLTYTKEGAPASTDIPVIYKTGWLDLGSPNKPKIIRGIKAYHTGTTGETYSVKIENFEGDSDTWTIDLSTYPTTYTEKTTTGAFRGTLFKITVQNLTGVKPFTFDKLIVMYDEEPYASE
jgi:hypothetical protein